ncbi:MAG: DNA adenine methylase [Candidatus Edwardsbacteria bacterium]|nr:DNA adenine methylase [Candidatus Edwardsbacteria bacterium]
MPRAKYLISWIGGKRLLREKISRHIPQDIKIYVEPFGGAGWVLFYKDRWARSEIYNDLDGRLVNLFLVAKYHPEELVREMAFLLTSREMFTRILKREGMTDIQRAARFLFLIRKSFGAGGENFGTSVNGESSAGRSTMNIIPQIRDIHKRLDKVLIENQDFKRILQRYDSQATFFYCDPPYSKGAGYQVTSTAAFDHQGLRKMLGNLRGRFLLSYDDSPVIRRLYKGFPMVEVSRQKGINGKNPNGRIYRELLIANYRLIKQP